MNYDNVDAVNYSTMKYAISHSLKHYKHVLDNGRSDTSAMVLGIAMHVAILQPDLFPKLFVAKPEGMTFVTREGKAWRGAHSGLEILPYDDYVACLEISRSVSEHPVAGQYVSSLESVELPIFWTDVDSGLACKCRLDAITAFKSLVELKSSRDIRAHQFARSAADLLYHVQQAYYYDAFCAHFGFEPEDHVVIAFESSAPYDVAVEVVTDDVRAEGRLAYKRALLAIAESRRTGFWPGIAPVKRMYDIPPWAREIDADG